MWGRARWSLRGFPCASSSDCHAVAVLTGWMEAELRCIGLQTIRVGGWGGVRGCWGWSTMSPVLPRCARHCTSALRGILHFHPGPRASSRRRTHHMTATNHRKTSKSTTGNGPFPLIMHINRVWTQNALQWNISTCSHRAKNKNLQTCKAASNIKYHFLWEFGLIWTHYKSEFCTNFTRACLTY